MSGIESERRGEAEWLTIASPPTNLLTPDLMRALVAELQRADADETAKAIVLTGAADAFCAGLDVGELKAGGDPVEFARELVALLKVPPLLGKPILGAINGDAVASGFSLALTTDVAIGVEGAKYGTYEASVGVWPMIAQVPVLQRLLPRHALSNIITGVPFTAERALEVGALNAVVPRAELDDAVAARIPGVLGAGPALPAGRRAFYRFLDLSYDDALDGSLDEFVAMLNEG